jgi:PA domain
MQLCRCVNIGGAQLPPTSGTVDYVFAGRACNGDQLSESPLGKVALIRRGTCAFSEKAANAAAAGATAAVIFNSSPGASPQATRLVSPVAIPVVGISGVAGAVMGASGTLTWTDWSQNGFYLQGCGSGGICNFGTLALVDSVVTGNRGTEGGGVLSRGTLTLAGSTRFSNDVGTFGGAIGHPAGTVNATDGTSSYTDPISGAPPARLDGLVRRQLHRQLQPHDLVGLLQLRLSRALVKTS